MSLHRGQGMDILWRDTLRCPTEDEYVDMVKASRLSSLSQIPFVNIFFARNGRSPQDCCQTYDGMCYDQYECVCLTWSPLISPELTETPTSDYIPLTDLIGVHFQIRDDYMNLQSSQVSLLCILRHDETI
jgi:geranylgeranyl diphosphate synthase type 3